MPGGLPVPIQWPGHSSVDTELFLDPRALADKPAQVIQAFLALRDELGQELFEGRWPIADAWRKHHGYVGQFATYENELIVPALLGAHQVGQGGILLFCPGPEFSVHGGAQ